MERLYKLFLTIVSLLLSFVVFLAKEKIIIYPLYPCLPSFPTMYYYAAYLFGIIILTGISIYCARFLSSDEINKDSITVVEPANDDFLPSYLGYFFVALSVPSMKIFLFVFGIISLFIYFSKISYFNPVFFLFGYRFYYIVTKNNIKVLLITRKLLKNASNLEFKNLRRINNYTFIDMNRG